MSAEYHQPHPSILLTCSQLNDGKCHQILAWLATCQLCDINLQIITWQDILTHDTFNQIITWHNTLVYLLPVKCMTYDIMNANTMTQATVHIPHLSCDLLLPCDNDDWTHNWAMRFKRIFLRFRLPKGSFRSRGLFGHSDYVGYQYE